MAAHFYPRPPRGGRQELRESVKKIMEISIHALREEGDCSSLVEQSGVKTFLSTPSARRATSCRHW